MTPERRLYIAVVVRAVEDAKCIVARMYGRAYTMYGYAIAGPHYERDYAQIMSELRNEGFGYICDVAGIHQDRVIETIEKFKDKVHAEHTRSAA